MTAATTQIRIESKTVEVADEIISRLNQVLADCPVCEEKQVDGQWTHVPNLQKRLVLQPTMNVEANVVKV